MGKITDTHNKWIRFTSWLLMIATVLVTPATTMAATTEPEAVNISPSSYIPMLRNNVCSGTRTASNPLGIQVYGTTGYNSPHFNLIQNLRSSWVRVGIDWSVVEPANVAPSQFKWAAADRAVRAAVDNCANMIVTIAGTPEWATIGNEHSPYEEQYEDEFVDFVQALVERYNGNGTSDAPGGMVVNYWEFYNEPDGRAAPGGGAWGNEPERYAQMLEAIYSVVKNGNPNAKVVFGGLAYDNFTSDGGLFVREFFDNVLVAGGGNHFDIMNLHYYPFSRHRLNWTESNSSGLFEKIADINFTLADHGLTKPIMITEIGWHSDGPASNPSNEDFQARHVVQMSAVSMAAGAVAMIWWAFQDIDAYPWKSGLISAANAPKYSYGVYQETIRRLGNATFVRTIVPTTVGNDLEVYEFREADTNKSMYVAWLNPVAPFNAEHAQEFNDSMTQNWQAPGGRATIYAKDGGLLRTVNDGDDGATDGQITVTVGRSPIYIVVD